MAACLSVDSSPLARSLELVVRRRELFLPEAAVSWWVAEYVVVVGVGGGLSGFRGVVGGCCGGRWWVWLVWLVLVGSAVARVWVTWEW